MQRTEKEWRLTGWPAVLLVGYIPWGIGYAWIVVTLIRAVV